MRLSGLACLLVGCSSSVGWTNVQPTLKFADRSDAEIARLISAAGGTDMFSAESQVNQFSSTTPPDPCPAIAISGNTVAITGGCTTMQSVAITGTATLTNPSGWDPQVMFQYNADSVYELHQLAFTQSSLTKSYDGTFRITDTFTTYDSHLTSALFGGSVHSDIYYHCDQGSQTCNLGNSGVELVGVGGALVSGTVHVNNAGSADYTLQGVDTLTAHLVQGCVAWTISGTSRAKTCP